LIRFATLLAVLVAFFVAATSASADPAPTAEGDIQIAEAFWGGPPTQCTSVTFGTHPPVGDLGFATQPEPGWSGPCELRVLEVGALDAWSFGFPRTAEEICLTMIHEEGHLHGFSHSEDPTNIMYGRVPLDPDAAPVCKEKPAPRNHPRRHRRLVRGSSI
jgi:hypothetical protein